MIGSKCGRKDCHPCKQETEKGEPCSRQYIVYESRCVQCNGKKKRKDEQELENKRVEPSNNVGESSRSLRERAKEHHRDYAKKGEDSHMLKHWAGAHPDNARP